MLRVVVQEDGGRLDVAKLEGLLSDGDDFPLAVLVDRILPGNGLLQTGVEVDEIARQAILDLVDLVGHGGDVPVSVGVGRLLPGDQTLVGVVVQVLVGLGVLDADRGLGDSHLGLDCVEGEWAELM